MNIRVAQRTITLSCGVLGALWWAFPARALDPLKTVTQYALHIWQIEDGLPQSSVLDLIQSGDGFLWLATYEGVVRFDGRSFVTFEDPRAQAITNALAEGPSWSLWAGTQSGLLHLRQDELNLFTTADGLVDDYVQTLLVDRSGTLWIGTQGGLSRFKDGAFTSYTEADGLAHNDVRTILEDRTGTLWIGTLKGLSRLEGGAFTTYTEAEGLVHEAVSDLVEDRAGALWIGTAKGGLQRFDGERFTAYTVADGLASDSVTALFEDRDRNLWIGTQDSGVSRFQNGSFSTLSSAEGMADDFVKVFLEDHEGSLWIGTWTGGLHRLKDGKVVPYTTSEGLADDLALPILEDRAGNLWIGTQKGLSLLRDGTFTTYTTADGLVNDFVSALHEDRRGDLWIGTQGGLSRLRDGTFENLTLRDGLAHDAIHALEDDRQGNLWIGTWGGGLARLRDGEIELYTTTQGLVHDFVMALREDREGGLWIGTTNGMSRLEDGVFESFTTQDGLPHNAVVSFHQDGSGDLWIGTDGGLSRFRDGVFTNFTTQDGLFNNRFFQILEDGRGNLWGSCNRGIFRVAKSELEELAAGRRESVVSVAYGTADGMKSRECNGSFQPAGFRARDGRLWFPTIRGVVAIDPEHPTVNPLPPPVVIDRLVAGSRTIALASRPRVELDARDFEIHYAGLSFRDPDKVEFRYRLEDYESEWNAAGTRRVAYYTNIPPGSYRFRVIASNEDGLWNMDGDALDLHVRPAFYQTWYFYALCTVAAVALGRGFHRLRVRHLLRRTRELTLMKEELEAVNAEMEAKNAELERFTYTVSHDLKSPVVTIKGFIGLLAKDLLEGHDVLVQRDLQHILKAATKMHLLLDELIELSRVGRVVNPPREISLDELVREAVDLVSGQISDRGVEVRVAPDLGTVHGDRTRLLEVFQNLIDNAVKYMGSQDLPVVEVGAARAGDGELVCHVRDNGEGIGEPYLDLIFGLFEKLDPESESTGIGLALAKRIVEFHGGRIWVESEGAGRGSTFFFTLPSRSPEESRA